MQSYNGVIAGFWMRRVADVRCCFGDTDASIRFLDHRVHDVDERNRIGFDSVGIGVRWNSGDVSSTCLRTSRRRIPSRTGNSKGRSRHNLRT